MAFSTYVGSFVKSTSTGAQAITGVGFTPKAIIFWSNGNTSAGTIANHQKLFLGIATSTSEDYCVVTASEHGGGDGQSYHRVLAVACAVMNSGGSVQGQAGLQSFDADGFTLDWTSSGGGATIIHFLALGGTDLTNAKAINFLGASSTGNAAVTGVGFVPDIVFLFCAGVNGSAALPHANDHATFGIGAMTSSAQFATTSMAETGVGTTDTYRHQRTDSALLSVTVTGTVDQRASYTSMDADGFTLNWNTVDGSQNRHLALCLKGGGYKIGAFNKATGAAPASQGVTGVGFQPTALLFSSFQNTATTTVQAHARFGMGACSATSEQSAALSDKDASGTAVVNSVDKTDKAFAVMDSDATIDAEADLTSMDVDGFTLSWSTNHATATEIAYVAFGAAGGGGAVTYGPTLPMLGIG